VGAGFGVGNQGWLTCQRRGWLGGRKRCKLRCGKRYVRALETASGLANGQVSVRASFLASVQVSAPVSL
jgi:hypothetical protein